MREPPSRPPAAPPGGPRRLSRRRLLQAGVAAGLVAGGSALAFVRTRGYELPAGTTLAAFTPWQYLVVQQAARRIVAPDLPGDASIPSADDLDVAGFVDGWVARMDPTMRRDLGRFLGYVEHLAPLGAGCASRFTRLGAADQDAVLASIESSSSDLLRAGFDGLRALVFLGYYRDARTWGIAGYDGPLVNRPAGGWR
ncbi:MAG TPA: gluconate 2-dehydrogenase subunit 3 family protein [Polyangiaceae bacterium]